MFDNTYYLTKIDEKWRRFYDIKGTGQKIQPTGSQSVQSAKTSQAVIRLNAVKNQLLASGVETPANAKNNREKRNKDIDSSVMRSVVVNFHKKPLEERLNEVIHTTH